MQLLLDKGPAVCANKMFLPLLTEISFDKLGSNFKRFLFFEMQAWGLMLQNNLDCLPDRIQRLDACCIMLCFTGEMGCWNEAAAAVRRGESHLWGQKIISMRVRDFFRWTSQQQPQKSVATQLRLAPVAVLLQTSFASLAASGVRRFLLQRNHHQVILHDKRTNVRRQSEDEAPRLVDNWKSRAVSGNDYIRSVL